MKINKTNKHSAKDDKDSNTGRTKKSGDEPICYRRVCISRFL